MAAPDWRTIPGLMELAEKAARNGLTFSQAKFARMWEIAEAAGVPPLFMLAILPQEGTGSFNTSAENRAADGGHGIEADWETDVTRAVNLVAGKLALYVQAEAQGWATLAREITSPGWGNNACRADGMPDQWINWHTAILRPSGRVDIGPYAQHASWWIGVRSHYLRYGGRLTDLVQAAIALDKRAPRVAMRLRPVDNVLWAASNWNATAPEPAVMVANAVITAPAPPPPHPAIRPCPVNLLNGAQVMGELRGQRVYMRVGDTWLWVREVAAAVGATVEWHGDEEAGGPRVDLRTPAPVTD